MQHSIGSTEAIGSIGVMVLVSEQVLPALQAIWQVKAQEEDNLQRIILLYTADHERSDKPAEQIEKICKKSLPDTPLKRVPTYEAGSLGITPQEVTQTVLAVKTRFPEIKHWIINASGGLKTMTIGVSNVLPEEKGAGEADISLVYRELNGSWFSLYRDGTQIYSRELPSPTLPLLKDIRVEDLVTAQFSDDRFIQESDKRFRIQVLEIQKKLLLITKHLIESKWEWSTVLEEYNIIERDEGKCFEKYLAACLCEMGIINLVGGLRTKLQLEKTHDFNENDIVINYNDQIYFLDLTLLSKEKEQERKGSVGKQVRDAGEVKRRLGGLSAEWVMIRPCRSLEDYEREIIDAQRNFHRFDQTQAGKLLPLLAGMFKVSLSATLEEVARLIRADDMPFQKPVSEQVEKPIGVKWYGKNWWLTHLDGLCIFSVTKHAEHEKQKDDWLTFLEYFGVQCLSSSCSQEKCRFVWEGSTPPDLRNTLMPFVGKPICLKEGALQELPVASVVADLEASDTAAPAPDADHS